MLKINPRFTTKTNTMTLHEKINKEWISLIGEKEYSQIEVDDFGWLKFTSTHEYGKYNTSIVGDWSGKGYNPFKTGEDSGIQVCFIRPRKLDGIENNNYWINIYSKYDLPTNETLWNDSRLNGDFVWAIRIDGFKNIIPVNELTHDNHSHWKPIKMENNPIY